MHARVMSFRWFQTSARAIPYRRAANVKPVPVTCCASLLCTFRCSSEVGVSSCIRACLQHEVLTPRLARCASNVTFLDHPMCSVGFTRGIYTGSGRQVHEPSRLQKMHPRQSCGARKVAWRHSSLSRDLSSDTSKTQDHAKNQDHAEGLVTESTAIGHSNGDKSHPTVEPRHSHVQMPIITEDEKFGAVTSWNVKVGDFVKNLSPFLVILEELGSTDQVQVAVLSRSPSRAGEVICEIELEQFAVGCQVETTGFVAEILVEAGSENIPVGAHMATIVPSEEEIVLYQQAREMRAHAHATTATETKPRAFSRKDVLQTVMRLSQEQKLSEDASSTLMALAREEDRHLLQAFDASFEGEYVGKIDEELFLVQARDIARTRRKEATVETPTPG